MSCDSGKDNASVVDSSLTEGKHDMGTLDEPAGSFLTESTDKQNEHQYPSNSEEPPCGHDKRGDSIANRKGRWYSTRYFIIKSLNHHNLQLSIEKGIWATQVMNEPILEEAFHNSGKVILIFSVNMSGFFQGYAQMMSPIGWRRDKLWSQGNGRNNPWGRSFKVKWLRLYDLPFQKTLHLKNPLNDNKPVKISRDCQELPQDVGEALCELLDCDADIDGETRRDSAPLERTSMCSVQGEEYNGPAAHMPWAMPYSSLYYPQHAEAARNNLAYARSGGTLLSDDLAVPSGVSKVPKPKHLQTNGNKPAVSHRDVSPRYDVWGLSIGSPLASTLTEDDFLDMSYEEYLEVHSRSSRNMCLPATKSSWTPKESSRSRKQDIHLSPGLASEQSTRKRLHHSSER
ncbi:zinc finger CCCH domain-containing protein 45 isoform X1 [Rhodamnia argentea]|uniref:YTH domain-containing family protein n=1 Tax=Rhodamnia argentea TaxID=178133 RepID=A0A8B8NRK4_9MYRT|nr:zinc finger CCCH domain-containing protein 45 isoform X1 [Rhodamnia argentea]XP_048141242.1 zinc finger CCCH domain-containing protein 45 isoform X1 [Rhodamnia argentea]